MTISRIQQSIEGVTRVFSEHPEKGLATDKATVATLQDGLVCRAEGPHGALLVADMRKSVGGSASALTPGWMLRAALAGGRCDSQSGSFDHGDPNCLMRCCCAPSPDVECAM